MENFPKQLSFDNHLMCGVGLDKFTKIIQMAMETRYGVKFSFHKLENVLCKVCQMNESSDLIWWDFIFIWQSILSFEGDLIQNGGDSHQPVAVQK
jgi:hypothetical protein